MTTTVAAKDTTARVVRFDEYGGPGVLKVEREEPPELGPGEARVRMLALALNRANALFRNGTYFVEAAFPSRIGTEGVGVIEALASDVVGFSVGQRVNLLPPAHESTGGYAAEVNVVPKEALLPAPKGLSDRQAATAWVPFLSVYHLLVERGLAAEGRWIVLPAASSSVALAANSLAHQLGAKTIGITRTNHKQAALETAGYDAVVVSADEDVAARIVELTGGGSDFVFDPVGGPQLDQLINSLKPGGEVNVYGLLDPRGTALPIFPLMNRGATLRCYVSYELFKDPTRLREAVAYLLPLFEAGKVVPVADDREFALGQIEDAFRHMESNTQLGKVIVTVTQ